MPGKKNMISAKINGTREKQRRSLLPDDNYLQKLPGSTPKQPCGKMQVLSVKAIMSDF